MLLTGAESGDHLVQISTCPPKRRIWGQEEVIRVKTDFLSFAFVSLAEFKVIDRVATVVLREFLTPH